MIEQLPQRVTWIKVDKPKLDLVGVILKSLGATAVLAVAALLAGILLGVLLIRRRRAARHAAHSALIRLPLSDPPGNPNEGGQAS
jgi:hypothetical protein